MFSIRQKLPVEGLLPFDPSKVTGIPFACYDDEGRPVTVCGINGDKNAFVSERKTSQLSITRGDNLRLAPDLGELIEIHINLPEGKAYTTRERADLYAAKSDFPRSGVLKVVSVAGTGSIVEVSFEELS